MRIFLYFIVLLSGISIASAQAFNITSSVSQSYANQTLNQTLNYIEKINQSSYLIFSPNLTKAYSYLAQAQQSLKSAPNLAVLYSNQAAMEAQRQYSKIGLYRSASLFVMAILTVLSLLWLYAIMRKKAK